MTSVSGTGGMFVDQDNQPPRTAVVITASLDAYGSDLQALQTVVGLRAAGWRVVVVAARTGRLAARLDEIGVELILLDFPILVRSAASARGVIRMVVAAAAAMPGMIKMLRALQADALYVNTVTIPVWLVAGRASGIPTACHVHEAEVHDRRVVRLALALPLLLATLIIVNSRSTEQAVLDIIPRLRRRMRLIYNGVEPPAQVFGHDRATGPTKLLVVGRVSPRKSPQTALDATALLRTAGHDVRLEVCGTAPDGMASFLDQLRRRSESPDLAGAVTFSGYVAPVWSALAHADIVLAPSLGESFGNAVVEAQLAGRPVVATAVQGHLETVRDGYSGLLVPIEDPDAVARAVERLIDDPDLAARIAEQGRESALKNFSAERYRAEIGAAISSLAGLRRDRSR